MNNLGEWIVEQILNEESKIKNVIAVYGGRFQPGLRHHFAVYKWVQKQFGAKNVYIAATDKVKLPKSPFNFKEKQLVLSKHGIPKSHIVNVKIPYKIEDLLSKKGFDPETTAGIVILGEKDKARINIFKSSKYYLPYKGNEHNLRGYKEHGYYVLAPHVSVKAGKHELSGAVARQLLGDPKVSIDDKKSTFKDLFGWFDPKIFKMVVSKLEQVFECNFKINKDLIIPYTDIDDFLIENDLSEILNETFTVGSTVDDGPRYFYGNQKSYRKITARNAEKLGHQVLNYIVSDGEFEVHDTDYPRGPVPAVSFAPAGDVGVVAGTNLIDLKGAIAWSRWMQHIKTVSQIVGYKVLDFVKGKHDILYSLKDEPNTKAEREGHVVEEQKEKPLLDITNELKAILNGVEGDLITEGGSYGHLAHPFDNKDLTFEDFKRIITLGLEGRLDVEGDVTEKTDGQAIAVSWKNGKLIAARNKGDRKNFGENALDLKGITSKFEGRGDIRDAFVFAIRDLEKAISALSDKQRTKIFAEGEKFMNIEIIWPASANVINYDKAVLQFHGSTRYDKAGNSIEYVKADARVLEKMIKTVNQHIQKKFAIIKPQVLKMSKHQDFAKKRKYFLSKLNRLQKQYNLSDSDSFGMYHQRFWEEFIYNSAKQHNYEIPYKVLVGLTKRWAFDDKSYKIPTIKKDIDNGEFLDWVLTFDKKDRKKYAQQNMLPFEKLFFELGAEILLNVSNFLASNPDKTVQRMKDNIDKDIKTIKQAKDPKQIELLNQHLNKINSYGGLNKIVPSEGLTFLYKGELYKITGNFGPINAVLGILKFLR